MSITQKLSHVKLKKVETDDRSAPQIDPTIAEGIAKYREEIAKVNVDKWYPWIAAHTMKTWFIPIPIEAAKVFIKSYESTYKKGPELGQHDKLVLLGLERKVDDILSQLPEKKAFVRCSTRSPKDSPLSKRKSRDSLLKIFDTAETENEKQIAFYSASVHGLKIGSGKEALELILTSTRIYEDLTEALQESEETFYHDIIIREWFDIDIKHEYRMFVNNSAMTAMCQFYEFCYFSDLKNVFKLHVEKIRDFWQEKIKSLIPLASYIIDFGITKEGKLVVIELNPFHVGTGGKLFHWIDDLKILKEGPFEARMTEKPPSFLSYTSEGIRKDII